MNIETKPSKQINHPTQEENREKKCKKKIIFGASLNKEEMEQLKSPRTCPTRATKVSNCFKRSKTFNRSFKQCLFAFVVASVIVVLLNPLADQDGCVEGKKLKKEKKVFKSLVKGLIFKNLSTKKNFLPLPVPIPGKWQQILTTLFEFNSDSSGHRKFSSMAAATAFADKNIKGKQKKISLLKLLSPKAFSSMFHSPLESSSSSDAIDLNDVKKFTRTAAAKYASKLIKANQSPAKPSAATSMATLLGKSPNRVDKFPQVFSGHSMSHRKLSGTSKSNLHKMSNDPIVTLFNLVKLLQQLKELDSTKIMNLSKKSSNPSKSNLPVLSMNINNKKSFLNKMNYIHTLTSDFNHRHRHFNNGLSSLLFSSD